LAACVESVLAQRVPVDLRAIVVDDGSPHPAADELGEHLGSRGRVELVRQDNAGPGAARNRGLESAAAWEADLVAFIDSDDRWTEGFLARALPAFAEGCDLLFGDSRRYGMEETRFAWSHSAGYSLDPGAHAPLDAAHGLYEFRGDFFDFVVFRSNIIGPSALIYRFDKYPGLRFDPRLFNGQDRLFKLRLSKEAQRVAFCTEVCASEGRGVNIFDSAGWGSEKSLRLIGSYIELSRVILRDIPMNERQTAHVRMQLRESRLAFATSLVHLLRVGTAVEWRLVGRMVGSDPVGALLFLPNVSGAVLGKLRARLAGSAN
jgi:succinoglycan biosynthesis protein ExoW